MTDHEMAAALKAKGWRVTEPTDPKTCPHAPHRRRGQGTMNAQTGSGQGQWTCQDCGHVHEWSTPADPKRVQAMANGFY